MAAVFAFVFLFALSATGLLYKVTVGGPSVSAIAALAIFFAMASGVFIGCFKMMKEWEGPERH